MAKKDFIEEFNDKFSEYKKDPAKFDEKYPSVYVMELINIINKIVEFVKENDKNTYDELKSYIDKINNSNTETFNTMKENSNLVNTNIEKLTNDIKKSISDLETNMNKKIDKIRKDIGITNG